MMKKDIVLIAIIAVISIAILLIFYKEIKVFVFNEEYAKTIGLKVSVMYVILLLMIMSLIAVGLKVVGAILIASLLIIPAVASNQWSNHFGKVILLSGLFGGISAFIGTWISSTYQGMSTGPTIIIIMGIIALISMIVGPRGAVASYLKRRDK